MKSRKYLLLCFMIFAIGPQLFSQDDSTKVEERWLRAQPVAVAYTGSGEYKAGQLVHINQEYLYINPNKGIPGGSAWFDHLIQIPLTNVEKILWQKGGLKLFRAKKATSIIIPTPDPDYNLTFNELKKAAIFKEALMQTSDMNEAFSTSSLMRRVFPDKFVRISFGVSFGPVAVIDNAMEALDNSGLPDSEYGWSEGTSADMLNISFRFFDRVILGGQFFAQNINTSFSAYSYSETTDFNYYYNVGLTENRIYSEYALIHVDRFFTRQFEVLTGVGLLLSKSDWNLNYNYANFEDLDNVFVDNIYTNREYRFQGVQLRGSFHYYFFPGLSLFAGLEANLYPSVNVNSIVLPSPFLGETIEIPEHKLSFTSVRFSLGVSIYL